MLWGRYLPFASSSPDPLSTYLHHTLFLVDADLTCMDDINRLLCILVSSYVSQFRGMGYREVRGIIPLASFLAKLPEAVVFNCRQCCSKAAHFIQLSLLGSS